MTKAILFIWLGVAQQQTMSMTTFDSLAECNAAKKVIQEYWDNRRLRNIKCLEYTFND